METNNKLREALKVVKAFLDGYIVNSIEMRRKVDAALAEPLRNCEVGTAEEQWERYSDFTNKYTPCAYNGSARCTEDCPVNKKLTRDGHGTLLCPFAWSQMPYLEGESYGSI